MAPLAQVSTLLVAMATESYSLTMHGPVPTGKTMTANAVANYLGKKVLLVTVSVMLDKDLTKVSPQYVAFCIALEQGVNSLRF